MRDLLRRNMEDVVSVQPKLESDVVIRELAAMRPGIERAWSIFSGRRLPDRSGAGVEHARRSKVHRIGVRRVVQK